jgi:hypothetical protein
MNETLSVNTGMPVTVMITDMLEPELPPLAAGVTINSNAISVETTELPKVQEAPHRFETVLTLGLGSTNIASTRIPVQPEKPKRAVFRDENGQLEGAYLSGDGSTDPAYYNVESPERSEK